MFPLSHMLKSFVRTGTLKVIDADGKTHVFAGKPGGPDVTMRLTDPSLYRKLFFNPELNAGEAYMDGRLRFENSTLRDFLTLFSINRLSLAAHPMQKALRKVSLGLKRFQQANPVGKAQQNVAHHYDLGNDFYKLFLDSGMQYSCAYFLNDNESLEQAQQNKLRLIAAKLNLKPGLKILDIGSGWGDMALYLARLENVDVTGVTLSKEQHALSNEKAKRLGLSDRVRFRLQDYREVPERFDRIVSVGMFEHVGVNHYGAYFRKLRELLTDDGVALIHTIGRSEPPTATSPFIAKYIFPGGYIPALSEMSAAIERSGLIIADLEVLRLHYAETLRAWRQRFLANWDKAAAIQDETFCRMWEFYLAASETAFRYQNLVVFQVQLAKRIKALPITRDYMYKGERTILEHEGADRPRMAGE